MLNQHLEDFEFWLSSCIPSVTASFDIKIQRRYYEIVHFQRGPKYHDAEIEFWQKYRMDFISFLRFQRGNNRNEAGKVFNSKLAGKQTFLAAYLSTMANNVSGGSLLGILSCCFNLICQLQSLRHGG